MNYIDQRHVGAEYQFYNQKLDISRVIQSRVIDDGAAAYMWETPGAESERSETVGASNSSGTLKAREAYTEDKQLLSVPDENITFIQREDYSSWEEAPWTASACPWTDDATYLRTINRSEVRVQIFKNPPNGKNPILALTKLDFDLNSFATLNGHPMEMLADFSISRAAYERDVQRSERTLSLPNTEELYQE
ncbi:hypothetical protein M231_05611 [Tremella mesenterica]|uniref:Uncharacterized protein n=1 Tax=Tremella mesenterica TaxID=5217 RepID=A0A4Q1BHR1_TREME|nr:hypothetical protein M231_05611 [Tremella mesenterica]